MTLKHSNLHRKCPCATHCGIRPIRFFLIGCSKPVNYEDIFQGRIGEKRLFTQEIGLFTHVLWTRRHLFYKINNESGGSLASAHHPERTVLFLMIHAPTEAEIAALLQLKSPELCQTIAGMSRYIPFSNNESVLSIGQNTPRMLFLVNGIARFYYMDPNGRELTQCFCTIPGVPLMGNINTASSLSGAHAVGKMTALEIPMDKVSALAATQPELMACYCRILNQALLYHMEIAVMLRCTTPQQRYQWLCHRQPQVVACAQKRHIASFLGVTPETYSRLLGKNPAAPSVANEIPTMYDAVEDRTTTFLWDQVKKSQFPPDNY